MTETLVISIGAGVLFVCIGISAIIYAIKGDYNNKSQKQKSGKDSVQIQIGNKTNNKGDK